MIHSDSLSLEWIQSVATRLGKVDKALLEKAIRAIIVYPMNALINSQREEFNKYRDRFEAKHGEQSFPIRYAQYTGQESEEEKQHIKSNPPDILLTNYMMLELIMTRSGEAYLRENLQEHLEFLAFDELHTYRGRQGSDIAMLIRRMQAKSSKPLRFMGTSATLVSGDNLQDQKQRVAELAELIFGKSFLPVYMNSKDIKFISKTYEISEETVKDALEFESASALN